MVTWSDTISPTSTGTSTALTTLNGGSVYTTSNLAGQLKEVIPVQAPSAALTAAQSSLQRFTVSSTSIGAIAPKNIILPPVHGGLGTFPAGMIPIVRGFVFNTPLPYSNVPITFQSQSLQSNTAGFLVGASMTLTQEQPAERENFYDCVSATTSSGTAAAAVSLNAITVNGASALTLIYAHFGVGTVTASNSYMGRITISSPDLTPIQNISANWQPVASGLGAAIAVLQPDQKYTSLYVPVRPTATISATNTEDIALTSASNIGWGLSFVR